MVVAIAVHVLDLWNTGLAVQLVQRTRPGPALLSGCQIIICRQMHTLLRPISLQDCLNVSACH